MSIGLRIKRSSDRQWNSYPWLNGRFPSMQVAQDTIPLILLPPSMSHRKARSEQVRSAPRMLLRVGGHDTTALTRRTFREPMARTD